MNIGKLRHRATIEHKVRIRDPETNEIIEDWQPYATRWASIEPLRGREYWAAAQTQAEVTHMVRMRYTPGITPSMRLTYRGRHFDINVVRNLDEENRVTEMLVTEAVRG